MIDAKVKPDFFGISCDKSCLSLDDSFTFVHAVNSVIGYGWFADGSMLPNKEEFWEGSSLKLSSFTIDHKNVKYTPISVMLEPKEVICFTDSRFHINQILEFRVPGNHCILQVFYSNDDFPSYDDPNQDMGLFCQYFPLIRPSIGEWLYKLQ